MPAKPCSAAFRNASMGKICSSSHRAAWGSSSASMKLRAASWNALWSSFSSKFMWAYPSKRSTRICPVGTIAIPSQLGPFERPAIILRSGLVHDAELSGFVARFNNAPVDRQDVATAAQRHRRIELLADYIERQRDALAAKRLHAVEEGAADEHGARSECDRLQHVLAGANAAVEENLHAVTHCPHNRRQRSDRRQRAVELPSAVIG